jgi:hypothetical protein
MQKRAIEQLTPDQFSEWIAIDIEARRKGGPDLQDKYLALVEQLPEEIRQEYLARTIEIWSKVENDLAPPKPAYRRYDALVKMAVAAPSFILPATQPVADEASKSTSVAVPKPKPEEQPEAPNEEPIIEAPEEE